ncbi:MAG: hypothetical protein ACQESR_27285 [Planctomycetota bacterium]
MFNRTFLAARIVVSFAAIVQAQSTDVDQTAADDRQLVPDEMSHVERAPSSSPSPQPAVIADLQGTHYFQHAPSHASGRYGRSNPTWREEFAYYRSVRQSFSRGPCPPNALSQFGPLWSTYCADKQVGYGSCRAAAPAAHPAIHPRQRIAPSSRLPCDGCNTTETPRKHTVTEGDTLTGPSLDIGEPPDPGGKSTKDEHTNE